MFTRVVSSKLPMSGVHEVAHTLLNDLHVGELGPSILRPASQTVAGEGVDVVV